MKLNVLYTALSYPPAVGGGQQVMHQIARELARAGHTLRVVSQWSHYRRDYLLGCTVRCQEALGYELDGVRVQRLGLPERVRRRTWPYVLTYYVARRRAVREVSRLLEPYVEAAAGGRPDVVHSCRMGREFITQASLSLARRWDAPFCLTPFHHERWASRLYGEWDRIYREADALIALTPCERDALVQQKGAHPERVHVVGVAPVLAEEFSVEEFRGAHGIRGPYVLFVGRHERYKGYRAILRAAPRVWRLFPETGFVFVGPQTRRSRAVFQSVRDERVRCLGAVDLRTKTAAIAGCELLCMPSAQESFGIVYCEAWHFGKPVIGGRIPQVAGVIDEGADGLLSSQDPAELADHICALLADPARADAMGERGRRKVLEHYTWPRLAEKTLAIYQRLL